MKNINKRYLAGNDISTEAETLEGILLTQAITFEDAIMLKDDGGALCLEIDEYNNVIAVKEVDTNSRHQFINTPFPLPILDWKNKHRFYLSEDKSGLHRFGGEKPKDLTLPKSSNLKTPVIFLGSLSGLDKRFSWLNCEYLPLFNPIYECQEDIAYYDVSESRNPKLLNPDVFTDAWYSPENSLKYQKSLDERRYSTIAASEDSLKKSQELAITGSFIECGVPWWCQFPQIPRSPKSGKVMRFVCRLNPEAVFQSTDSYQELYFFYDQDSEILATVMQVD